MDPIQPQWDEVAAAEFAAWLAEIEASPEYLAARDAGEPVEPDWPVDIAA
jgi:hypothetical protein